MIAGFDPSVTHFGWVVFDEAIVGKESVLEAGVFKTDPTDGLLVQRLIIQRERVRMFLTAKNIKFVAMEAPYMGDFNTEMLYSLNQYMHDVFLNLGIFVFYVQSSTWKSMMFPGMSATDVTKHHSSHLAKTELDRHGRRFSEHVADAYHLGKIGHRFYNWYVLKTLKDSYLTPKELDLFCGKHTYVKGVKKGITDYYGTIYRENEQFYDFSKQTKTTSVILSEITKEITNGVQKEGKDHREPGGCQGNFDAYRIL